MKNRFVRGLRCEASSEVLAVRPVRLVPEAMRPPVFEVPESLLHSAAAVPAQCQVVPGLTEAAVHPVDLEPAAGTAFQDRPAPDTSEDSPGGDTDSPAAFPVAEDNIARDIAASASRRGNRIRGAFVAADILAAASPALAVSAEQGA